MKLKFKATDTHRGEAALTHNYTNHQTSSIFLSCCIVFHSQFAHSTPTNVISPFLSPPLDNRKTGFLGIESMLFRIQLGLSTYGQCLVQNLIGGREKEIATGEDISGTRRLIIAWMIQRKSSFVVTCINLNESQNDPLWCLNKTHICMLTGLCCEAVSVAYQICFSENNRFVNKNRESVWFFWNSIFLLNNNIMHVPVSSSLQRNQVFNFLPRSNSTVCINVVEEKSTRLKNTFFRSLCVMPYVCLYACDWAVCKS